jgi:carbonic anhydrase
MEGNKRYLNAHPVHPHQTRQRLIEISDEQNPFAVIVSCSDSRVPPEIIFDQGLGDLFVIRTAGNVIGDYELASIEYAINKLQCRVLMVMGHDSCGAIKTFIDQPADSLPGHLNTLVGFIKNQPYANEILAGHRTDRYYQAAINNIIYGITFIKNESPMILNKFNNNDLEIIGAVYHVSSGNVHIITDEEKP